MRIRGSSPYLAAQARLAVHDREQVIAATIEDRLDDLGLRSPGVDGDQRAGERKALEQHRDGDNLVGLGLARLLAEHEAQAAGSDRHHVARPALLAAVVHAS